VWVALWKKAIEIHESWKLETIRLGDPITDPCLSVKNVATLALGSRPKQEFARLKVKREAQESHLMLSRVQKTVKE
jgi:hypothetical protein